MVTLHFSILYKLQIFLEMIGTIKNPHGAAVALSLMKLTSCLERALGDVSAKILEYVKPVVNEILFYTQEISVSLPCLLIKRSQIQYNY